MTEDEWVAFIGSLQAMVLDVVTSVAAIHGQSARCLGIAEEELPGRVRDALRDIAASIRVQETDIVARLFAFGRELDRMREGGEL